MRDIIWTVIIIWVIFRIISAFRSYSSPSSKRTARDHHHNAGRNTTSQAPHKKGELKPDAGEYIDYEEIK